MVVKQDSWTVVILGKWNKYILSPEWSAGNIFNLEKLRVEFGISVDLPPRYIGSDVRMTPSEDTVIFTALEHTDEALAKIEEYASSLFEKLPYTPIGAFGINFGFVEKAGSGSLSSIFDLTDDTKLVESGCSIKQKSISRQLNFSEKTLNLTIAQLNSEIAFEFNFHYDVKNCQEARAKLNKQIIENKVFALRLLKDAYDLNLEEE